MILTLLIVTTLQAKAATWIYNCYEIGDAPTHLPTSFVLEQKDNALNLRSFLYHQDIALDLTNVSKGKAHYDVETNKYSAHVKADNRLRSGGAKTAEGNYVGTLEVSYDDYREEYFQAYFCKRKMSIRKP